MRRLPALFLMLASIIHFSPSSEGVTGSELWTQYQNTPHTHAQIPNCSFAGYRRGEAGIPSLPIVTQLTSFGGNGNGSTDNSLAFKRAIDDAWLKGGGAVSIPAGTFVVNDLIFLNRNGVVLRGAGKTQTFIQFKQSLKTLLGSTGVTEKWNWAGGQIWFGPTDLISLTNTNSTSYKYAFTQTPPAGYGNTGPGHAWEYWHPGAQLTHVTSSNVRGNTSFTVNSSAGLKANQVIMMTWDNLSDASLYKEIGEHSLMQTYNYGAWLMDVNYPRIQWPVEIKSVSGNTVTIKQPLRYSIQSKYNVKIYDIGLIVRESGIEDLSITLQGSSTLGHNAGVGWNGVYVNRAYNCWLRNVEVRNGENGIHLSNAKNVSFLGTSIIGNVPVHHPYTTRLHAYDNLYDGFTINNSSKVMHGINTEWLSSGNVWTRGSMNKGTFDSHRALSFDYMRTDISVANDSQSWPGGANDAGPYTGRRATHWNVRVSGSDRPSADTGLYIYQPDTFVLAALVGIQGATQSSAAGIAMPAGNKNVVVADHGVVPNPSNLYDAQKNHRKQQAMVEVTSPHTDFAKPGTVTLSASANASSGRTIASVSFYINGQLVGTDTSAPYSVAWTASGGVYDLRATMVDSASQSFHSNTHRITVANRRRVENTDTTVQYSASTWTTQPHPAFSGGNARTTSNTGAWIQYTFTGTRIQYYVRRSSSSQRGLVYLDNMTTPVATLSVHSGLVNYQHLAFDSGELTPGTHTIKIVKDGESLMLDYFDVVATQ